MMEQEDFEKWIDAVHSIFEIFEGRYDAYPICRKWIDEWYGIGEFNISQKDIERLNDLRKSLDYSVFRINDEQLTQRIDESFKSLIDLLNSNNKCKNIGLGVAPYLFTWNFQRFKEYFKKKKNFDLESYFTKLEKFFETKKGGVNKLRKRKIYAHEVEKDTVERLFNDLNDHLKKSGIHQNEPVGVAKLLHIFAPYYFPLIDNPIAEAARLKQRRQSISVDEYVEWMKCMKKWLERYDKKQIENIEEQFNESILKLIDEGFYVMSSINLSLRIKLMGLEIGGLNE